MADPRLELVSGASEEKTEPFSESEMDARFKGMPVEEPGGLPDMEAPPLDSFQVEDHHHRQNIRILMRPLTQLPGSRSVSPGSDSCQWLALRAEVASFEQPEHKVLAVTQTSKDIKFSVRIPSEPQDESSRPPLWCELYYDPASDRVIFLNKSHVPLSLSRIFHTPPPLEDHVINPNLTRALQPGTWRITLRETAVLDFRVLEKRPVTLYQLQPPLPADTPSSASASSQTASASGKRPLALPDQDGKRSKRRLSEADGKADDSVIMFLRPAAEPLVFPLPNARESKELSATNGHALLDAERGEKVAVPGVCEVDGYELTKREPIASTSLSAVYKATHSRMPDNFVTVKVLKTRVPGSSDKPFLHERNVIRQADMWLRECHSQEDLAHDSIVRYYGGDARFLSLYMEHVEALDLGSVTGWRNEADESFLGHGEDALRIVRDITSALDYIHSRKRVHNDIKPANILYSRERGAVLCDFGLSTSATDSPTTGGTPYYVPPEFIGNKLRGPPSDVWALGITMLYVLHKIPFPDSRGRRKHPKPLYWQIVEINRPSPAYKQDGNGQPAISQMRDWLTEIFEAREKLNSRDRLERLVKEMLTPNPNQRITMAKVLEELPV